MVLDKEEGFPCSGKLSLFNDAQPLHFPMNSNEEAVYERRENNDLDFFEWKAQKVRVT